MQDELVDSLSEADGIFVSPVIDAGKVPEGQLLDVEAVVREIGQSGRMAFTEPAADAIVERLQSLAEPGDVVVVLSNGGFDGIHAKLLEALRQGADQ